MELLNTSDGQMELLIQPHVVKWNSLTNLKGSNVTPNHTSRGETKLLNSSQWVICNF